MFAVIKTGGKQYRVAADDELKVEKVAGEAGDLVEFDQVMAMGTGTDTIFGQPFIEGARVTAEVVEQGRTRKIIAFKKRRRQNSRRTIGHRQHLTTVRIAEILEAGAKPTKSAAKSKPAKADSAEKVDTGEKADAPKSDSASKSAEAAKFVDDVSLIGGVGPALTKKLAGAGVTSLKQIADMDDAAIAKLDETLKLGGRTIREEWVEQAKELVAGKPPRAKTDQKAAKAKK